MLEKDFTPADVKENMGDIDFANDFAMDLWKALNELKVKSEEVGADCLKRKRRLEDALTGINKYFGDDKAKK
jgi:hypothetical protein